MVYGQGADPRNATLKTGEYSKGPGKLLTMDGTTNTLETTDATDICIGVSAGDSTRDADGALQTSAGATVAYYPLGGVLMVQVDASSTFNIGETVYVGGSGLATSTAGSNKKLGLYVGDSAHAATALVANGNGDTDGALLSEGAMIPVDTHGAAIA